MTAKRFSKGQVIFSGYFPEDLEFAKKTLKELGLTKQDVRLYKKTAVIQTLGQPDTPYERLIIEALRPVVVEWDKLS